MSRLVLESHDGRAPAPIDGDAASGEFTEVESGKRADRPELAKAIAFAKKHRARLIIAKLDRLSRNVAFISALMSKVDFIAVDNPHATKRTREALAAAKAKGRMLGNYRRIAAAKQEATRARAEPCGR